MFSTLGLFRQLTCPEGNQCQLLNCIFSHVVIPCRKQTSPPLEVYSANGQDEVPEPDFPESDLPRKKRRIHDNLEHGESPPATSTTPTGAKPRVSLAARLETETGNELEENEYNDHRLPASVTRGVSPPPLRERRREVASTASNPPGSPLLYDAATKVQASTRRPVERPAVGRPAESLNPRILKKAPASHAVRLKLVTLLYEQMTRLNKAIKFSEDPSKDALELSPQEMITEVLDEEQRIAKENHAVYANLMKLRIVALKKMKVDEWRNDRLKHIAKQYPSTALPQPTKSPVLLHTGLQVWEEIALVSKIVAQQSPLAEYGYVLVPPSESEIERARQGVEATHGWEQCDRCKSRFQVFPGRRAEDGALTTGGKCHYHYGKPLRPTNEKADSGHKEPTYSCCTQSIGTSGCTIADTHVFKVSEAKRLALILQFKKTPSKGPQSSDSAVCFDCEMGYTTLGMELIRLTATSWPDGSELLDVLVRPMGEILDLNFRFSGVWPHHFNEAMPYPATPASSTKREVSGIQGPRLQLVDSPSTARELLFELLTTQTPLIGHALENDLNAVRIIHPTIVDTVLLYPHPRGLPIRYGLKMLVKKHLNRDIQMGGEQGHDSKEDARAAGDLVRLKVAETWKAMMRDGWTVDGEGFNPPLSGGPAPLAESCILGAKRKHP